MVTSSAELCKILSRKLTKGWRAGINFLVEKTVNGCQSAVRDTSVGDIKSDFSGVGRSETYGELLAHCPRSVYTCWGARTSNMQRERKKARGTAPHPTPPDPTPPTVSPLMLGFIVEYFSHLKKPRPSWYSFRVPVRVEDHILSPVAAGREKLVPA